ncbi:MAG: sugar phosphate isomerase/epimerase family protein [Candidatus Velthaea sp.]|jgi:hexulose-6-phosphate isomerase
MQGRLVPPEAGRFQSFPREGWRREFPRAQESGLDAIEWIYDTFGEDVNPLATDEGIAEMRELGERHGVAVVSLCADYFMDRPIVKADAAELRDLIARLYWLIDRARRVGITRIVVPFVDASRIDCGEDRVRAVSVLRDVLPAAESARLEIHLETDLAPEPFAQLLADLNYGCLKVNYDSGNSSSLGYNPREEFRAYGARIGSVHIKDRQLGGSTRPLGQGDADLPAVFRGLHELRYAGDYVLQAARGDSGGEVALARLNREFVANQIEVASNAG